MKKLNLKSLFVFLLLPLAFLTLKCSTPMEQKTNSNIHHSAYFVFNDSLSSSDKELFFKEINKLASIPGVINFKVVNEISPKNPYNYGVTMEFESQEAYSAYNSNPMHVDFVQNYWLKMVADFMEIDYQEDKKQ